MEAGKGSEHQPIVQANMQKQCLDHSSYHNIHPGKHHHSWTGTTADTNDITLQHCKCAWIILIAINTLRCHIKIHESHCQWKYMYF